MNYTAKIWRLIVTQPLSGAENMAIDESLLRSFDPISSLPILRLYGWNPPSLSLGRFQKTADILDFERCKSDQIKIVRRITGGGVIYHADELTYSMICAPSQIPPTTSIKESFRLLAGFLLIFYSSLGIKANYARDIMPKDTTLGQRTAFCFAGKESFDILADNNKIGGNAQRRMKGVIFQHGSIPFRNHAFKGLSYMLERLPEYAENCASLAEFGIDLERSTLLNGVAEAFKEYFAITFQDDSLLEREKIEMERLLTDRYNSDLWNIEGVEM